jgi:hypothetical protein
MRSRKPKATSLEFARTVAADLARPLPEPPIELSERARTHWGRIYAAKRPDAWTTLDLMHAGHLACDFVMLEDLRATLSEPFAPATVANIADLKRVAALIDSTQSRTLATCRALQINAASTQGRARDQAGQNAEARHLRASLFGPDDDLIARPNGVEYDDDDLFA